MAGEASLMSLLGMTGLTGSGAASGGMGLAGAAASGGMSMLLPLLLGGGSTLLGGLMNKDPYAEIMRKIAQWSDPRQIGRDTDMFNRQFLGSSAFGSAKGANLGAANNIRNQLQSRLAGSGLGSTGIGQAAQSLGNSALGPLMSKLYAGGYEQSQNMAQMLMRSRLATLGAAGQPQNIGGGIMGAGLGSLGDLLKMYMNSKYPQQQQRLA